MDAQGPSRGRPTTEGTSGNAPGLGPSRGQVRCAPSERTTETPLLSDEALYFGGLLSSRRSRSRVGNDTLVRSGTPARSTARLRHEVPEPIGAGRSSRRERSRSRGVVVDKRFRLHFDPWPVKSRLAAREMRRKVSVSMLQPLATGAATAGDRRRGARGSGSSTAVLAKRFGCRSR